MKSIKHELQDQSIHAVKLQSNMNSIQHELQDQCSSSRYVCLLACLRFIAIAPSLDTALGIDCLVAT
eukprot:7651775-Lingulodinium_polyedra.AAC.2